MKTVFLRVLEADDKAAALHAAIRDPESAGGKRFEVDIASFAAVPRSSFAYWVRDRVRALFSELPPLETERRTAKCGLVTGDDFRYPRSWSAPLRGVAG